MSNMVDVRTLRPGQRILFRPKVVVEITARTSVDSVGWAIVHTTAGNFNVKLPMSAQLVD